MWLAGNSTFKGLSLGAALAVISAGCLNAPNTSSYPRGSYPAASPLVMAERARHLDSVISAVEDRLDRAKRWCGLADLGRFVSGPHGSGFLRLNPKDLSLPYVAVIDLGTVGPAEPAQLAGSIAGRIRGYMQALNGANRSVDNKSELSFLDDRAVDSQPSVADVAVVAKRLAERLAQVQLSAPTVDYFPDSKGRRVPHLLLRNEAVIPLHTCVRYVSSAVRYDADAFAGVRIVSLNVLFNARVWFPGGRQPIPVNILPSQADPGGPVLCDDLPLRAVFMSQAQIDTLHSYAIGSDPGSSLPALRERLGLQWVQEAFEALAANRYLKALKRFHAGYDALSPLFSPRDQQLIEVTLRRWLRDDFAILAQDIRQQIDDWLILSQRPDLFALYANSGAWNQLVEFAATASRRVDLAAGQEAQAVSVPLSWDDTTQPRSKDFSYINLEYFTPMDLSSQGRIWADLLATLQQAGDYVLERSQDRRAFVTALRLAAQYASQLSAKTGPLDRQMEDINRMFQQRLTEMGYRLVPLYAGPEGQVGVLKQDAGVAKLDPEAAAYWRWPAPLGKDLPVFDTAPKEDTPLRVVGVWMGERPGQQEAHEAFLSRLKDDCTQFRW